MRKSAQQLADELEHERHKAARLQQRLDTLEEIIKTMPGRMLESGTTATESDTEREALAAELDQARRRKQYMRADLQRAQTRVRELEDELAKLRVRYQTVTIDAEVSVLALERTGGSPTSWLDQLPPLLADLPDADHDLLVKLRGLLQGAGVTTESLTRELAAPRATVVAMLTGEQRLGWADIERVTTAAGVAELSELRLLHDLCPTTPGWKTGAQQPGPPYSTRRPGPDGPAPASSTDAVYELQNKVQNPWWSLKRFRRRALRRGYNVDDVDAFLDRVEATMAGDPIGAAVTARAVRDVVFRSRLGGYDERQVKLYLDRVERQLSKLEQRRGQPDYWPPVVDLGVAPEQVGAPDRTGPQPGMDGPERTELRDAEFVRISRELKYTQSMAATTREQLAIATRDRDAVLAAFQPTRAQPRPSMPARGQPAGLTVADRPTDEYLAVHTAWEGLRTALAGIAVLTTILGHGCDLDDQIDVGRLSAHVPADDGELLPIVWRMAEIRSWCAPVDTSEFSGNTVSTGYLVPNDFLAELFTTQCADVIHRANAVTPQPTEPYLATPSRTATDTNALVGHRRRVADRSIRGS